MVWAEILCHQVWPLSHLSPRTRTLGARFPPWMPQNRPWVISHSLSVEKIVLWDGFGGFEVLSVAATVIKCWRIPVRCPQVSYPWFLRIHGIHRAFSFMEPSGVDLQGSGEGERGWRGRRWLLSPLCTSCKLWYWEKCGSFPEINAINSPASHRIPESSELEKTHQDHQNPVMQEQDNKPKTPGVPSGSFSTVSPHRKLVVVDVLKSFFYCLVLFEGKNLLRFGS